MLEQWRDNIVRWLFSKHYQTYEDKMRHYHDLIAIHSKLQADYYQEQQRFERERKSLSQQMAKQMKDYEQRMQTIATLQTELQQALTMRTQVMADYQQMHQAYAAKQRLIGKLYAAYQQMSAQEGPERQRVEQQLRHAQQEAQTLLLNSEQLQKNYAKTQTQVSEYENKLVTYRHQVTEAREKIEQLEASQQSQSAQLTAIEEDFAQQKQLLEQQLAQQAEQSVSYVEEASTAQAAYEQKIKQLTIQLAVKEKRTRQKRYEEAAKRFQNLYTYAKVHRQFIEDFIELTDIDQLKVEQLIAMLHYDYAKHSPGIVRPSPVKLKNVTIIEGSFSKAGRIYFKRAGEGIRFFRISTTKNGGMLDQKKVIEWLRANQNELTT
ncbi:Chromosome partition protein Smc [Metalysinibacillus saudimassiliensis]|uniref:Chromosome partition protein Smc n=1 Tax=Metalysinibacillus saudimassiliensis TaxID=1461583 RepID=A0A078M2L7_9BACL|nr:Chromosome partition protein Smc [Metalysinibacillus saudimassiliensis]